ncbi:MAG: M1 family aminopeptidase [Vicinamibacterales bacterium]
MKPLALACALLLLTLPARAQEPAPPDQPDGINALVLRLQEILIAGDRAQLATLVSPELQARNGAPGDLVISNTVFDQFADDFIAANVRRGVALERDRSPLLGSLPGDGFRLIVEFFTEIDEHARLMTARLDVRRPAGGDAAAWRIVGLERLSLIEGLYQLRLDASSTYAARNFYVAAEDLRLTLTSGLVVPVRSDAGVTGLVMLGQGLMRFAPPSDTERGQIRIFANSETLTTPFEAAYVRMNPEDYSRQIARGGLEPVVPETGDLRRAEDVFRRESEKSFSLDLDDLSPLDWFLVPEDGDFLAEIRTRRFDTLTYSRMGNQAEDISVFNRDRRKTISIYPSAEKLAGRGRHYDEDELSDFDVVSYDIEANVDPDREMLVGRARLTVRARAEYLATLTLRLNDTLNVTSVLSPEFGRLLFLRVSNQNSLLVSLPSAINAGAEATIIVNYGGYVEGQRVDSEALALAGQFQEDGGLAVEPSYLLSNRAYWYPQNAVTDYATARLRLAVPARWNVVATGERSVGVDTRMTDLLGPIGNNRSTTFTATEPVRYLALVASRFVRVVDTTVAARDVEIDASSPDAVRPTIALAVEANVRQQGRAREVAAAAAEILRFYGTLIGDTPYPAMTIAVVENELPGGHSPGYAAMLNSPPPGGQFAWRNDPAAFLNFPDFFIAHELAHQWWGQAVGWKNYHEQWISEGFAQYFSALYAQQSRGEETFREMLRQFRRWAMSESDEGPVHLGYRLGHVKGDSRIFRALVYNKGAAVLHMLRQLAGDEAFFRGLRRFYTEQRFQKAGTDDFQRAMEEETGMSLDRFFERWIYGAGIPRIRYSSTLANDEVVMTFEQVGEDIYDVPVTVTITPSSGAPREVVVPVTERRVEHRIPVTGAVRRVQVNQDNAALAEFAGN